MIQKTNNSVIINYVKHIAWVLDKLYEASMRVSREKSNFF